MTLSHDYLEDSKNHLFLAASKISEDMTDVDRFQAVLFSAIGIEKLLKHLLAEINPAFILKNQDFESVAIGFHRSQITACEKISELEKKATLDVVTIKSSIQRASIFFEEVRKNSQFIHAVADLRDIAAHRPSCEINKENAALLLTRDLYSAVNDIASCINLTTVDFFKDHNTNLKNISTDVSERTNLNEKMRDLLIHHRKIWERRKTNASTAANAVRATQVYLSKLPESTECQCPACGNRAIATIEPDWDYDPEDRTAFVVGVSVIEIHCLYCALKLDRYDQLNYVDADRLIAQDEQV